ncbi:MAG: hypothetical protein EAZ74_01960 [Alphaproteobacteria bacterium]|nr:MAG: hypothetical protein EAY65_01750 [Alphaproteobacteria bacterium]TAF15373.1 MAG: hypothetical protein EAZ74_01960 [Alphaproteobacteria bacterium]TAF74993.1 MAG: hypothetical protein EAZ52_07630 [Alphaproteobacteria bacterium]
MELSALTTQNKQATNEVYNTPKLAVTAPVKKSDVSDEPVLISAIQENMFKHIDMRRMHYLEQIMREQKVRDVYGIGEGRFTIFKDTHGRFIIRLSNARDNSVTYLEERDVMKYARVPSMSYFHLHI